jgi:hypothetical protein
VVADHAGAVREAIFIGIYAYGWDRLRPRLHFWCGVPIAIAGVAGWFFVIAVNGWMNHPTGFMLVDGRATDVHPWRALFDNPMFWSDHTHMYFAAYIVCGFLLAGMHAWAMLRTRTGRIWSVWSASWLAPSPSSGWPLRDTFNRDSLIPRVNSSHAGVGVRFGDHDAFFPGEGFLSNRCKNPSR